MRDNSEIVYSTDPLFNKICSRCKKRISSCTCPKNPDSFDYAQIRAFIRMERKHRGGKEVTVVERLPASEDFLKSLSGELKKKCGAGGTYKVLDNNGVIEIQGDKYDQVKSELLKLGIQCK
jgi:translation initiation factor 1